MQVILFCSVKEVWLLARSVRYIWFVTFEIVWKLMHTTEQDAP
jgi:hypothetical protein